MSSQSDRVVFDEAVSPDDSTMLFNDKKWVFVNDTTSSNGSFGSQLQFDLQTLGAQSQNLSWSQIYLQFPVRIKVKNAGGSSISSVSTTTALAGLKPGFHQFVDSAQLVVDGQTMHTAQAYSNIDAHFKIISTWSKDTLQTYGATLGVPALDSFTDMDNASITTLIKPIYGVDMTQSTNPAYSARQSYQNVSASSGACASILSSQAKNLGKSQVATVSSATITAGSHAYTQFLLATVRLCDIFPAVKQMPLTRNAHGFVYINLNTSTTTLTYDSGSALTSISTVCTNGRTSPLMLSHAGIVSSTGQLAKASATWEITCEVSAVPTELTSAQPQITTARLVAPYYIANPSIDSAITMKKTFRYLERITGTFDISAGATLSPTLTSGVANVKGLLLFPYFIGSSSVSNLLPNPLLGITDTCPATTSPFAGLNNFQVLVQNRPIFTQPIQYDGDIFMQEIAQEGLDGGLSNEVNSGLLSAVDFDRLYRYYYINIGRRLESEDGSSKSVIVQTQNATTCNMRVIWHIFYEKVCTIDSSNCRVSWGV